MLGCFSSFNVHHTLESSLLRDISLAAVQFDRFVDQWEDPADPQAGGILMDYRPGICKILGNEHVVNGDVLDCPVTYQTFGLHATNPRDRWVILPQRLGSRYYEISGTSQYFL
jgi:hypothetical protein